MAVLNLGMMIEIQVERDEAIKEIGKLLELVKKGDFSFAITKNGERIGALVNYEYFKFLLEVSLEAAKIATDDPDAHIDFTIS